MGDREIQILLADDDKDDCLLFKEALEELGIICKLTIVNDGQQLVQLLDKNSSDSFHVLFLDLNMPRKNGFVCLKEIKCDEKMKQLPVIIYSTSCDEQNADLLYSLGAQYYICKPTDFSQLKKLIQQALALIAEENSTQPPRAQFMLNNIKSILL
jgi:CheY-like chemotaxis protein